jgi:flavodoxin
MNTEKVAKRIGEVLDAEVTNPKDIDPGKLSDLDMIGFGSGIYGEDLHKMIHEFVDKLPDLSGKKAFIFSTNGAPAKIQDQKIKDDFLKKNHAKIRSKLESKGLKVVGDFSCPGFNTNLFMKFFGGLNKGRPNSEDLKNAEDFARKLIGGS